MGDREQSTRAVGWRAVRHLLPLALTTRRRFVVATLMLVAGIAAGFSVTLLTDGMRLAIAVPLAALAAATFAGLLPLLVWLVADRRHARSVPVLEENLIERLSGTTPEAAPSLDQRRVIERIAEQRRAQNPLLVAVHALLVLTCALWVAAGVVVGVAWHSLLGFAVGVPLGLVVVSSATVALGRSELAARTWPVSESPSRSSDGEPE